MRVVLVDVRKFAHIEMLTKANAWNLDKSIHLNCELCANFPGRETDTLHFDSPQSLASAGMPLFAACEKGCELEEELRIGA